MAEIQLDTAIDGPGTHALVVGVSRYPFLDGPDQTAAGRRFGLEGLSAAARSAAEVARWLLLEHRNPDAPLASLHVLLAPSEGEALPEEVSSRLPAPYAADSAAVRADLLAFRDRCREREGNVAFVYVAGHGVQLTKRGAIVLLEDVAAPGQARELEGAIDMANCHAAFNADGFPSRQVWFVDACRQRPSIAAKFEQLTAGVILDEPASGPVESSPLFLASSPREAAFARVGGMTLFSTALLAGLRGAAAEGPDQPDDDWQVSVYGLAESLNDAVKAMAGAEGADQRIDLTGRVINAPVQRFERPPDVRLRLELEPVDASGSCTASLLYDGSEPVIEGASDWPLERLVKPGLYTLRVDTEAPYQPIQNRPLDIGPPEFLRRLQVRTG